MAEKTEYGVELIADGDGVFHALDSVNAKIGSIQKKIDAIVRSTDLSAKQFDKEMGKQLNRLQTAMSKLATLEKSLTIGASDVRQVNQARSLATATKNATQFAGTLKNAENTSMALTARLNDIDKQMVKIATRGGLAPNKLLEDRRKLEEFSRALAALDRQYSKLTDKARQSGGDFSGSFSAISASRQSLFAALKDGSRTDFTADLQRLKDQQAALGLEIGKELAGRRASLRVQKEQAIAQARELQTLSQIVNARKQSEATLAAARARLAQATGRETKDLLRIIDLEKARTAELARQERLRTPKPEASGAAPDQGMFRPGTLGGAFAGTARYGIAAAGIYSFVAAAQQGIQFAIEFEDALANLQAIASATDTQMQQVAQNILQVGTNSKSSIIELTDAATTLAQAGFTSTELEQSLDGIARLSAASGATIKESVDLVTSAVGSFGLQASETNRITDVLVAALNRSKLSVEQVGLAIQYAGTTARENNISFDELVATAGALANAGIRSGSTIGTGLRQLLVDLKTPSEDLTKQLELLGLTQADVDVKTKGLAQVMTSLRDAGFGAAQAYGSLEVRAAASFLTLSNNLDLMQQLLLAEQQQGVAMVAQERAMDSLSAQWQRFLNILAELTSGPAGLVTKFLGDVLQATNDLLSSDGDAFFQSMADGAKAVAPALVGAIEMYGELLTAYYGQEVAADRLATEIAVLNEEISAQQQTISSVEESIQNLLVKQGLYKTDNVALQVEVTSLASRFEGLSGQLAGQAVEFDNVIAAMRRYRVEAQQTLQTKLVQQQANLGVQSSQVRSGLMRDFARIRAGSGPKELDDLATKAYRERDPAKKSAYLSDLIKKTDRLEKQGGGSQTLSFYRQFASDLAGYQVIRGDQRLIDRQLENSRFSTSQTGQRYYESVSRMQAGVNSLSGLEPGAKRETASKIQTESKQRQAEIERALKNPKSRLTDAERNNLESLRAEYVSLENQARAATAPTAAEEKASRAAERDAAKARREAERDARRFNRGELRVSQTALKTAELDLTDALENIKGTDDFSVLSDGFKAVEAALAEWKEKRLDVMADEIKAGQLTGAQADNLNREVNSQIEAKFRDVRRAYGDAILKLFDNQIAVADRAFTRYLTPFEANASIASARTASLDREALRGRVPEFVREEQERRQNLAQEALDRATIVANEEKILSYTDAMIDLNRAIELVQKTGSKEAAEMLQGENFQNLAGEITVLANVINGTAVATGKFSNEDLQKLRTALEEVQQKIDDTKNSNLALKASFQGEGLLPESFSEGLRRAAQNYSAVNGLNNSFKENLIGGLDTAISDVHGTWNQFMYDMLTKPNQVLANFQSFAMGIIQALQRMAAEALANQIFGTILKLVGSAFAPSVSNFDVAVPGASVVTPVAPLPGFFNGGIVGYSEGGMVNHGVPNRDSVLTGLARGEYVVRKKAVDSVGRGFLDGINKNGAAALPSTAIAMPAPAHNETNVYVVKENPPPQMGPNDVLAVVANDVLKDGQMKRLIKHVSQGG